MSDINTDTIKHLGKLSRIGVTDDEAQSLKTDLENIVSYVDTLGEVDVTTNEIDATYRAVNTMREDETAFEKGAYSDKLLKEAPDTKDGYIKVNKVL